MEKSRRDFLSVGLSVFATAVAGRAGALSGAELPAKVDDDRPPVRAITRGPKFHWFGYYDKFEFDPTNRYVLGMEIGFEGRSPTADDEIRIGMVDLADHDRWIDLGASKTWSWQQGCMLQWIPGSADEIIWNDREGDEFIARILNVKTGAKRTLPRPFFTLSPDGRSALGFDFHRLSVLRPDTGYRSTKAYSQTSKAPADAGIYRMDLASGASETIATYADIHAVPSGPPSMAEGVHFFEQLLFAPDGRRFAVLNRWRADWTRGGFVSRLMTMNIDGTAPFVVDPSGVTSHFDWRDGEHLLVWTRVGKEKGFFLFRDQTAEVEQVGKGVMTENGHCHYSPDGRWILNDTYPDAQREQHLFLFEVATGRRVPLTDFRSPRRYSGEWRCDTHPRFNRDGRMVCIDSPHEEGRQLYLIDTSAIIGA